MQETGGVRHPPSPEDRDKEELAQYLERDEVMDFISKINKKYLHWNDFRHRNTPENTEHKSLWFLIKSFRRSNMKHLEVDGIELSYTLTNHTLKELNKFDLALGGQLEATSIIPERDKQTYLISSLMEEAIASSQLEGAATTREEAKQMLRRNEEPENKDQQMILNNYRTIQKLKNLKGEELTPELIREVHESICHDTLDDEEYLGSFRDSNDVKVYSSQGEVLYSPPEYKHIPKMIEGLCDFVNGEQEFIHPILKATILHFCIGYIHPFVDGNGRTARALFYWYLISNDYWIIEYLSISRIIKQSPAQYKRAYLYTETDGNDLTYFIHYQLDTLDKALTDLEEYIERKMRERKQLYSFQRLEGINERQADILNEFASDPQKSMTIQEHQSTFSVSYQTARSDLLDLVERGLLEKKKTGRKYIFYKANDFDEIVEQL